MPQPGWYPDPYNPSLARWFDGQAWSEHTSPLPNQEPAEPELHHQPLAKPEDPQTELQSPAQTAAPWEQGGQTGLPAVTPPDMQALAASAGQAQQFEQGVAVNYQPPSPSQQAAGTIADGGIRRTPSTLWTGLIAILVGFLVSLSVGVGGAAFAALGLLGGAGGVGFMFIIFMILAVAAQLFLTGLFAAYFFKRKGYYYPSRWNLVAGFVVASLAFGAAVFIISLILAVVIGKSGSGAVSLLMLLLMLPLYIYLAGKLINLANTWSVTTGKVVTIASGVVSTLAVVLISATLGAAILALKDAAENGQNNQLQQLNQGVPGQQEMQKQLKDQMEKQGVPDEQQQQLLQQMQQQSQ